MKKIVFVAIVILAAIVHFSSANALEVNGHVDLYNRPIIENEDGSYSTIASIGIGIEHYELLVTPITEDGYWLSDEELDEAIANFVIIDGLVTIESDPLHLVINIVDVDGLSEEELERVYDLGYILHLEQEAFYGIA